MKCAWCFDLLKFLDKKFLFLVRPVLTQKKTLVVGVPFSHEMRTFVQG